MGLSQQIGASSLIKPGVIDSAAQRPASPYEGQVVYERDTDLTYIYNGSAWQQVSGGTAVGNSGLVFVKQQIIGTAVPSVTVTNAFSAEYDNYRIIYTNGNASLNDVLIQMTIGSPVSTYRFAQQTTSYGIGAVLTFSVSGTGGVNFWNVGYTGTVNETYSMIELQSPFLAINKTIQANGGRNNALILMNGIVLDAVPRTSFTLTPASGTLTGGTITVYGYRK